jgi:hypothetical protein
MRRKHFAALACVVLFLAVVAGMLDLGARADSPGTPAEVGAFPCISEHGGHATVPAGSAITIRQRFGEQTLGILRDFLGAQTTITSANDAPMVDDSDQWSAPVFESGAWFSFVRVPTGVTLANPGDQMRFTFALLVLGKVPEVFNPAAGGPPGQPAFNGPGLALGGTCTVTAT